ncbi:MAG: flavodoxin [Anaerolineae bacterium]|nr:flavodoxin [Anaerolineae bacterium]
MRARILVAYASKSGTAVEVAHAIGEAILQNGAVQADVMNVRRVDSLKGYNGVVLGSAIRMGSWLPEALAFARGNREALNALPTAIFTVHLLNTDDTPECQAARAAYIAPVLALFAPVDVRFFTGRMDHEQLGVFERLVAGMVKAGDSDQRHWQAIRDWGAGLPATLRLA